MGKHYHENVLSSDSTSSGYDSSSSEDTCVSTPSQVTVCHQNDKDLSKCHCYPRLQAEIKFLDRERRLLSNHVTTLEQTIWLISKLVKCSDQDSSVFDMKDQLHSPLACLPTVMPADCNDTSSDLKKQPIIISLDQKSVPNQPSLNLKLSKPKSSENKVNPSCLLDCEFDETTQNESEPPTLPLIRFIEAETITNNVHDPPAVNGNLSKKQPLEPTTILEPANTTKPPVKPITSVFPDQQTLQCQKRITVSLLPPPVNEPLNLVTPTPMDLATSISTVTSPGYEQMKISSNRTATLNPSTTTEANTETLSSLIPAADCTTTSAIIKTATSSHEFVKPVAPPLTVLAQSPNVMSSCEDEYPRNLNKSHQLKRSSYDFVERMIEDLPPPPLSNQPTSNNVSPRRVSPPSPRVEASNYASPRSVDLALYSTESLPLLNRPSQSANCFNSSIPPPVMIQSWRPTKTEPLPPFDGRKPEIWISFKAVYNHLKSVGFLKDELLAEISSAVYGNARRFIDDELLTRSDPDIIVATLEKYFGDPRRILYNLVKDLEDSKPPYEAPKHELLEFALKLKTIITTARALNQSEYLNQPVLCDIVTRMIRGEHQDYWANRKKINPQLSFIDLADYLLDCATLPSGTVSKSPTIKERKNDRCFFCHGNHELPECSKFSDLTPSKRRHWLTSTPICSSCLLSDRHSWKNCPNSHYCDKCNCKHHPIIHMELPPQKKRNGIHPNRYGHSF